jgi:hypothetical protein
MKMIEKMDMVNIKILIINLSNKIILTNKLDNNKIIKALNSKIYILKVQTIMKTNKMIKWVKNNNYQ